VFDNGFPYSNISGFVYLHTFVLILKIHDIDIIYTYAVVNCINSQ